MNDFVNALEQQLIAGVRRHEQRRAVGRRRHRWARGRKWVGLLLLPAAGAIGLAVFALAGVDLSGRTPNAYALPVLHTQSVDARAHRSKLRSLQRARMDFAHAHQISTPFGTGYVMTSADGNTVCVAVPDTIEGYGQSCSAASEVRSSGLVVSMVAADKSQLPSELVVVLPSGASPPVLRFSKGGERRLPIRDGVASAAINHDAILVLTIGDRTLTQTLHAVEPQGLFVMMCKDGYSASSRSPKTFLNPETRRRVCAHHGGQMG